MTTFWQRPVTQFGSLSPSMVACCSPWSCRSTQTLLVMFQTVPNNAYTYHDGGRLICWLKPRLACLIIYRSVVDNISHIKPKQILPVSITAVISHSSFPVFLGAVERSTSQAKQDRVPQEPPREKNIIRLTQCIHQPGIPTYFL